jgi:hypothetical protein
MYDKIVKTKLKISHNQVSQPWTSLQDKSLAEFTTIDLGVHLQHELLSEEQNCPT